MSSIALLVGLGGFEHGVATLQHKWEPEECRCEAPSWQGRTRQERVLSTEAVP